MFTYALIVKAKFINKFTKL